jgi:pimeloyl-ACP methyl ester carboxylesterase
MRFDRSTTVLLWLAPLLSLAGCATVGNRNAPLPQSLWPAPAQNDGVAPLVVVLPGRFDSIEDMQSAGMVEAVQSAWPEADVLLVGASLAYYTDGGLALRLSEQVVAPARARGVTRLWMVGASMGGMGALLYDRAYPAELDGIVLLAPYLGERRLLSEIASAGGVLEWQPGPPRELDASTYQRELWRHISSWRDAPQSAARVWVGYGDRDRLRDAVPVLAPLLPPTQVLERSGPHAWSVWVPLTREIFAEIASQHRTAVQVVLSATPAD